MTLNQLYPKMEPFPDLKSTRYPGSASLIKLPVQNLHQQEEQQPTFK